MATLQYLETLMLRSRRTFLATIGLTLLVLGLTVIIGWLLARTLIREQISQRDADLLYAATMMEQMDVHNDEGPSLIKSAEQIGFDAALLASRMKGVLGIRFFDAEGRFTDSFPANILPQDLEAHTLRSIHQLKPRSNYRSGVPMSDVFIYLPSFATGRVDRIPTLEVTVPLHQKDSTDVFGAAQFIVEGHTIAAQYHALDQHLAGLAGQTLLIAGAILGLMLWLAFRRVEKLHQRLASQNRDLSRANEELAMAARTSALGAVSAHLMHGLKNPLASLSRYVRDHVSEDNKGGEADKVEDWQDAVAATRRMQALVEHTMEVLADARGEAVYEVQTRELVKAVDDKVATLARQRNVQVSFHLETDEILTSRTANLVQLILVNLVENAIHATPAGKTVSLDVLAENQHLCFRVRDEGHGFPAHLRSRLFLPCKSTREGGSGIGLSLCKQLTDHLAASLELSDAPDGGCLFSFLLPLPAGADPSRSPDSSALAVGH